MAERKFSQNEVNRIVASRLNREHDRLTREYENSLKRCMAAVHLTLYQEMCALKQELDAETNDLLRSDLINPSAVQPSGSVSKDPANQSHKGGGNV